MNDPTVAHVWADLGSSWIIEDQYFKPHPVCRWAQAAVEAALVLRRQHEIDAREIESIDVSTFHEAARLVSALPATTEQAQYSLPFPLAAALVRGHVGAAEVSAEALRDPSIRSLSERVTLTEDDGHNAVFPATRLARVTLTMVDGRSFTSEDTEPRGDPEAHLNDAEIRRKFHMFADPVLGENRAGEIERAIDDLVQADSLATVLDLLAAPI